MRDFSAEHTVGISLDHATRLDGGEGTYCTTLSPAWEIWGPNGGYLAALALRAASMDAMIDQPASFYCHFLSSPKFAAVELNVSILKRGRRSEALAVEMTQEGKHVLQALVRTAADAPGYEHQQILAPDVAAPDELRSIDQLPAQSERARFRFWENIERRPIDQSPSSEPKDAIVREWARFRPQACFEDPFLDAARSLILLDTYGWPAAYRTHCDGRYIAPNLDTSVWFHRFNQSSEWLLIDHECSTAHHGLLGVSGRVWDTEGRLLASSGAQLCCIPA
jgi:acyl-CoA thioesterase-2